VGYEQRTASITVAAPRQAVLLIVSDANLVAEWGGRYNDCAEVDCLDPVPGVCFSCRSRRGYRVEWRLTLSEQRDRTGTRTTVTATLGEHVSILRPMQWVRWKWPLSRHRAGSVNSALNRIKWISEAPDRVAEAAGGKDFATADLVALLNVYTTQFGSYTTLLWQVPALGLTAQAFLLVIALGAPSTSNAARFAASGLSIVIAFASVFLMHDQRGRAVNQAELARRLSYKLSLKDFLGDSFKLEDAKPRLGNAQDLWAVDHSMYHLWRWCMYLFILADMAVIASLLAGLNWFT
jgi:hypothetical protein